ncbi:MAG: hypothetical protein IJT43_09175 [Stomatobaculum sp.]|nr:hypothetical protein [Stomatobaculum sp.]
MNEQQNTGLPLLYSNYLKTCRILAVTGGVILIASLLLNELLHLQARGFVIPAVLIGIAILLIGVTSLRPQNQVKAFSVHLYQKPSREAAEAVLAALQASRAIRLGSRHYTILMSAVQSYCSAPDSDPELTEKLSAAAEQSVHKGFL